MFKGGVDEGGTLETGGWKNHFVYLRFSYLLVLIEDFKKVS